MLLLCTCAASKHRAGLHAAGGEDDCVGSRADRQHEGQAGRQGSWQHQVQRVQRHLKGFGQPGCYIVSVKIYTRIKYLNSHNMGGNNTSPPTPPSTPNHLLSPYTIYCNYNLNT